MTHTREIGKKTFQPSRISWSYLYLGTIAFIKANTINNNSILTTNQIGDGTIFKGYTSIGGNQPPKKRTDPIAHINRMFAYSPNQKSAYIMPEYSV